MYLKAIAFSVANSFVSSNVIFKSENVSKKQKSNLQDQSSSCNQIQLETLISAPPLYISSF